MFPSISIIFLGFAGFLLALYLFHKKRRRTEPFVCPLRGSCVEVIHSDYSTFLGVPVERLGIAYYAFTSVGHGLLIASPIFFARLEVVLLLTSTAAFLFSLYLTFIQLMSLRKICTWCFLSALFCLGIFVLTLLGARDFVFSLLAEYKSFVVVLHILFMALGLGAATLADIFFFKFLKDERISAEESDVLSTLSQVIWLSLGLVIVSGVALFLPEAVQYLSMPKFLAKMVVVGVIVVNGAFLNLYIAPKLVKISFGDPHNHKEGELGRARRLAFALGPISIVSWYAAFILGSLPADTPLLFFDFLKIYLLVLIVAVTIGQFVENRFAHRSVPWTTA